MSDTSWMLTPFHAKQLEPMLQFPVGLRFATFEGRPRPVLLVKAPKECILAAKINGGFKIYLVPLVSQDKVTTCLVSAFFDDGDSPLTLTTPLFKDYDSETLWLGLWGEPFDVHFFSELNQEMLAYTTEVETSEEALHQFGETKLMPFSLNLARSMHDLSVEFMGFRTPRDDDEALHVKFLEPIFPVDLVFLDMRPHMNRHQASPGYRQNKLERSEPGPLQELDILGLLRRVFRPDQLFHGPLRITDSEEIADVVIVTDTRILLIQAKDSPNTSEISGNLLSRKQATSIKQLTKAADQAAGAIRYTRSSARVFKMRVGTAEIPIQMEGRALFSLLVVKELFNDAFGAYDPILLNLAAKSDAPCVALDYPELAQYTAHLPDEDAFFGALHRVYDFAMIEGTFPRLRFGFV